MTDVSPITVEQYFEHNREELKLRLLNSDAGLKRAITSPDLHRPGLSLAGFMELFNYSRMQILGNTETRYLSTLTQEQRRTIFARIMSLKIPCFIITNDHPGFPEMMELADQQKICIFSSELNTTALAHHTVTFLEDAFAPRTSMHGTLVDVYGTGLLLTGRSGIGKSEIALDLVERGHRLVADDVVLLKRKRENVIIGTGKEMFRHLMEIRGLGFIDVRNLFGIRAIRIQKRVETIVDLKLLEEIDRLDRTGLQNKVSNILGVEIPLVELPIFPGKNITVICEVIALNLHLKVYGYDSSKEFNERIMQSIQKKRLSRYLSDDTE